MTDRDKFLLMLQCIAARCKIIASEVPLDESTIKTDIKSSYTNGEELIKNFSPDTWIAGSVQMPNKKMILLIEMHGDSNPVICAEVGSNGIFVAEILDEVVKAFGKFSVTFPFFHSPDGQLYFGQDAYVQYTTSMVGKLMKSKSALPPASSGKKPPTGGRFN